MTGECMDTGRRRGRVRTLTWWMIPALAVLSTTLRGQTVAERVRAIPLDVAVENGADVWSRADGTGYANDVVVAAFRAGGIDPHLIVVPYSRCKAMVITMQVASCFSMSKDPSIPASIVFADSSNFTFRSDFYQNVARPLGRSPEQLKKGTLVGAVRGYEYPEPIRRLAQTGVIRLVEASSEVVNLRKLAEGRLAAALINTDETKRADDLVARAGVASRVSFAYPGGSLPGFVGFNTRHPRGNDALVRFNAGRRIIASNGVLAAIKRRWADSLAVASRGGPGASAKRHP